MKTNVAAGCLYVWSGALLGCAPSSLGYDADKTSLTDTGVPDQETPADSGTPTQSTGTQSTTTTSTSSSPTTPTTTTTTSATSSTATGTGTGTGTTTTPTAFVPGPAGTYRGTIRVDYELVVPLIGGSERCTGDMELVWDPDVSNNLSGPLLSCDWPLLSIWANLTMGDVEGSFDGVVLDGFVSGNTVGGDGNFWSWNDPWTGIFHGDTIIGGFDGRNVLVDNYSATFELTYTGS